MSIRLALSSSLLVVCVSCATPAPRLEPVPAPAPLAPQVDPRPEPEPKVELDVSTYRDEVETLVRAALTSGLSYEMLSELCTSAPHRLAGSGDAQTAVDWAERTMRDIGLANVHTEPVTVPHWVRGKRAQLTWVTSPGNPPPSSYLEPFAILALGGSVGTPPDGLSAGVIEVENFDELNARAAEARGKFVFFNRPMDPAQTDCFSAYGGAVDQRGRGASEAARVGGVGAIVRSVTMRLDDVPHTGAMRYEDGVERVPSIAISTASADRLSAMLRNGSLQLHLDLDCQTLEDAPSFNVVGEIVGRENPDEVVLIGGHLDNWDVGQGAHDDGAGCAHSLEAARLILASGLKPRRTIRVVLFMNEENGTRGAQAYFDPHEHEHHVMALESDAGGFTPRGFTTDANPRALEQLRSIAPLLELASADRMDAGHGGVDIGPLAKTGVPLIGFRPDDERYFDYHHSERDTLEAVHPRELALGAGAIAGLVYVVAEMPERLPANPPPAASAAH